MLTPLIFIGFGQVARQVAMMSRQTRILIATTREPQKFPSMEADGVDPFIFKLPLANDLNRAVEGADILISIPPDGSTDASLAPLLNNARRIIYVSSTSVYGATTGVIDEDSQVDRSNQRAADRLQAEDCWLESGACVLRAPAIYGPQSGLHLRLRRDNYVPPASPNTYVSRIHLVDLANILVLMFKQPELSRRIYVCGDTEPSPHWDVVEWVCKELDLALPEMSQTASVRGAGREISGNRQINGHRVLRELDYELKFPTYREGYRHCIDSSSP